MMAEKRWRDFPRQAALPLHDGQVLQSPETCSRLEDENDSCSGPSLAVDLRSHSPQQEQ